MVLPGTSARQAVASISPRRRRWLLKSRFTRTTPETEPLLGALAALQLPPPQGGLAALRRWGQSGERPAGWIAAADPVYLEARLDHLVLHALSGSALPEPDAGEIFDYLQRELGEADTYTFSSIGTLGYLHAAGDIATATASPAIAAGDSPGRFLPEGAQARAHDRLQGEVQMCLHEAHVNVRRAAAGLPPVNALWIWGGGVSPQRSARPLPALYADDPLFRGYWYGASAEVHAWPGDLDGCRKASPDGFVAVLPEDEGREIEQQVCASRRMLQSGGLRSMTLLFGDGWRADLRRSDMLRLWRRGAEFRG